MQALESNIEKADAYNNANPQTKTLHKNPFNGNIVVFILNANVNSVNERR
jgi:hypothetical protein